MAYRSRTESRPRRVRTRTGGHPLRHLHWLSVDAVGVLLAYQWALGRWVGNTPPLEASVFLGAGIWLGYTADRLLDLQRRPTLALRSAKHAFYLRHREALWSLWFGTAVGASLAGALILPTPGILWAGAICAASALYLWWAGSERGDEAGAGKGFATVALLTVAGGWWMGVQPPERPAAALPVAALFALAGWWNLALLRHSRRPPLLPRTLPVLAPAAAILLIGFVPGSGALASCALVLVGGLAWASHCADSGRGGSDVPGVGRSDRDGLALAVDGVLAAGMVTAGVLVGTG
jgi:hypothetical protein